MPVKRRDCITKSCLPAASAASNISLASARLMATGFSQITWQPALKPIRVYFL